MQHGTVKIRDEDRHAMTAVGSNVVGFWIACSWVGADGGQQESPRRNGYERESDAQRKQQLGAQWNLRLRILCVQRYVQWPPLPPGHAFH
jgi:hypothetical protein